MKPLERTRRPQSGGGGSKQAVGLGCYTVVGNNCMDDVYRIIKATPMATATYAAAAGASAPVGFLRGDTVAHNPCAALD